MISKVTRTSGLYAADSGSACADSVPPVCRMLLRQLAVMALIAAAFFVCRRYNAALLVCALAVLFAALAVLLPGAYVRIEAFGRWLGKWAGNGITVLLLAIVFCICFLPARLFLMIVRDDPLRREFPSSSNSCWFEHGKTASFESYRRQS